MEIDLLKAERARGREKNRQLSTRNRRKRSGSEHGRCNIGNSRTGKNFCSYCRPTLASSLQRRFDATLRLKCEVRELGRSEDLQRPLCTGPFRLRSVNAGAVRHNGFILCEEVSRKMNMIEKKRNSKNDCCILVQAEIETGETASSANPLDSGADSAADNLNLEDISQDWVIINPPSRVVEDCYMSEHNS